MDVTVMQLLAGGENKKNAAGDTRLRPLAEPVPPVGLGLPTNESTISNSTLFKQSDVLSPVYAF